MGYRTKAWNLVSRLLFLVVFAASIAVFWFTRSGDGFSDLVINLIFAVIAAGFLIAYFEGCARPLARVASALSRTAANILRTPEPPEDAWERYSRNPELFGNRRLDERWRSYLQETARMQRQNALTADCRIEDYINEDFLYSTVNKPFCDQLGGIMSGLGILFTFIGLVYGLRSFDASAVDAMQASTQALMSGIKIAFLTSIFGLIYSLLFGLSYKKLLRDSTEALYEFQDAYTEMVRPTNEHAAENAMLRMQAEQNAAMRDMGTLIGRQVGEAVSEAMQPAIEEMRSTLRQYVAVAMEDQRAGMEKVVRYFLESMNSSLGGIFVQLKNRTEELARWEKDMTDNITVMLTSVARAGEGLQDAEETTRRIADTMVSYTDAIEKLTRSQRNVTEKMTLLIGEYERVRQREEKYLENISVASDAAAASTRESVETAKSVASITAGVQKATTDSAQEIAAASRAMKESALAIRAMSDAMTADMNSAAARLAGAARDIDTGMTRAVSDSLSLVEDGLARLTEGANTMNAASASLTQGLRSLPRTVSGLDSDVKAAAKQIDAELRQLLKAISDTQKSLNRFSAELDNRRANL